MPGMAVYVSRPIFTARCTRGIEIACRPSVCPSVRLSVTLVDQERV